MSELLQVDQWLFELLNGVWRTAWLDALMPYWREKSFWIPFYAALAVFLAWRFRWKMVYYGLAIALAVAAADHISSEWIKKSVRRLRPCNDPTVREQVELLISCGSGYSFTSSHAANHFAVATLLSLTLGVHYPRIRLPLFLWAVSIAYAQVYVGVHYPLDVIGGGLLGVLIGVVVARLYLRLEKGPGGEKTPDASRQTPD